MLVQKKTGHINSFAVNDRKIDWLPLQWYEAKKRILRKQTEARAGQQELACDWS